MSQDTTVSIDHFTKFWQSVYIRGRVRVGGADSVPEILFSHDSRQFVSTRMQIIPIEANETPGISVSQYQNYSFSTQILFNEGNPDEQISVISDMTCVVHDGVTVAKFRLVDLLQAREAQYPLHALYSAFEQRISSQRSAHILDIGGRQRSAFDSRANFKGVRMTVLDIVDGPGVDVVGDAHRLTNYFEDETFDFALSVSVFEHLHTPWLAVCQLNRVLRLGGEAFILTHQTLGMHDIPYDFWRFSGDAWKSLFNETTGFEILEVVQDHEMYVLPFVLSNRHLDAEHAAGYEVSCVWTRKIGQPIQNQWEIADSLSSSYVER